MGREMNRERARPCACATASQRDRNQNDAKANVDTLLRACVLFDSTSLPKMCLPFCLSGHRYDIHTKKKYQFPASNEVENVTGKSEKVQKEQE